jgi:two-component sensor histidine kinase/PAS domain-containing protein
LANHTALDLEPQLVLHVQALRDSGLLHSARHEQFDTHIALVRRLLDVPVAIISLIESDRQIFAGHQGLPQHWAERGETPLTHSFCQYVVARDQHLRVVDARDHPQLKDNLAIEDLGVVAYLGVPLRLPSGETVGALAAIDSEPRQWSEQELADLQLVAAIVTDKIGTSLAEASWQNTFEQLREGIVLGEVVRDASGAIIDWRYLQANEASGTLLGVKVSQVVGRTVREVFPDIEDIWIDEFAEVVRTGKPAHFTRQVGSLDRWYDGHAQATGRDTFIVLFIEVTSRVKALEAMAATQEFSNRRQTALIDIGDRLRITADIDTMVETSSAILGAALGAGRVGYGTVDAGSETILIYRDWHVDHLGSVSGVHHFRDYGSFIDDLKRGDDVIILDTKSDPRTRDNAKALLDIGIRVLVNIPLMEAGRLIGVMLVHYDDLRDFSLTEANFVRAVADRIHAAILQARSLETERLRDAELGHRLKNLMAMVQAVATQTLKGADIEDRRAAFTGRLSAMANAHDILLNRTWSSAPLRDTVEMALVPHAAEDRIVLDGPDVELDGKQALAMSLAVHELATNSTKYGALRNDDGTVSISWSIDRETDMFRWRWQEAGGPPVVVPTSKGFGSRLISRVLPHEFGGTVSIEYPAHGVVCDLVCSAGNLANDAAGSAGSEAVR